MLYGHFTDFRNVVTENVGGVPTSLKNLIM